MKNKKEVLETICTCIIIDLLAREQALAASGLINFIFKSAQLFNVVVRRLTLN